jgi:hypothetical protein
MGDIFIQFQQPLSATSMMQDGRSMSVAPELHSKIGKATLMLIDLLIALFPPELPQCQRLPQKVAALLFLADPRGADR